MILRTLNTIALLDKLQATIIVTQFQKFTRHSWFLTKDYKLCGIRASPQKPNKETSMKLIAVAIVSSILSVSAFAKNMCVDSRGRDIWQKPEVFQKLISEQTSCHDAAELATACAWGSSLDVSTAGIAIDICGKQLKKNQPQPNDLALMKQMEKRCDREYQDMQGTMYMSMNAYCHLEAIRWLVGVTYKDK